MTETFSGLLQNQLTMIQYAELLLTNHKIVSFSQSQLVFFSSSFLFHFFHFTFHNSSSFFFSVIETVATVISCKDMRPLVALSTLNYVVIS